MPSELVLTDTGINRKQRLPKDIKDQVASDFGLCCEQELQAKAFISANSPPNLLSVTLIRRFKGIL
jgi:hypothetical protein